MKFFKQLFNSTIATTAIVMIVIVLILAGAIPYSPDVFGKFLIGCLFLVLGQTIFLIAIDDSVIKVGKLVGNALMKKKNVLIIIVFGFLFGLVTTIAEPDVQVLVGEIIKITPFLSTWLLLSIFAIGCGLFVCFGLVRILKHISLKWILFVLYSVIILLCCFVPNMFVGIAFDAGGVTTGCVTVPFILALATGICAIRSQSGKDDTFGLIAITSIGPILAMLILGLFVGDPSVVATRTIQTFGLGETIVSCLKKVALAFLPLFVTFLIAQFAMLKLSKREFLKISIGFLISAVGLVLFLIGINYGFTEMGKFIGQTISFNTPPLLIILVGAVIGLLFVFTDPAIVVVVNQVEEITGGLLKKWLVFVTLAIGISLACVVAFVHVIYQINLMFLIIPIYLVCIVLNFFVPKMFTALAFDSGGVASGTMTVAFLFPIAVGLCEGMGLDVLSLGFGIVGCVATVPILAMQVLGLIYGIKQKRIERRQNQVEES